MKLRGKVAIIAGGGRGLGRSLAPRFGKEGARVVLAARNHDEIDHPWNKESCKAFRRVFEDRRKAEVHAGRTLNALSNLRPGAGSQAPAEPPPPLSGACRTCYKAYGI